MLWFHLSVLQDLQVVCLSVASGLWVLQTVTWLAHVCYQNLGGRSWCQNSISPLHLGDGIVGGFRVEIPLRRRTTIQQGQYVYITIPSLPHSIGSSVQAHPYLVAWINDGPDGSDINVILLIQCQQGFSKSLKLCEQHAGILVDGPYGKGPSFEDYDKAMFIASGVGITAHLLAIRSLLRAHNNKTARTRRISLLWVLECKRK